MLSVAGLLDHILGLCVATLVNLPALSAGMVIIACSYHDCIIVGRKVYFRSLSSHNS